MLQLVLQLKDLLDGYRLTFLLVYWRGFQDFDIFSLQSSINTGVFSVYTVM